MDAGFPDFPNSGISQIATGSATGWNREIGDKAVSDVRFSSFPTIRSLILLPDSEISCHLL